MKFVAVRILSGNNSGSVVNMRKDEAELAVHTGYGEIAAEMQPLAVPASAEPEPKANERKRKSEKAEE
jgi:hypothetical protein